MQENENWKDTVDGQELSWKSLWQNKTEENHDQFLVHVRMRSQRTITRGIDSGAAKRHVELPGSKTKKKDESDSEMEVDEKTEMKKNFRKMYYFR